MEETIVFPSPNWFHVSIMGISQDGWLVYGGPSKSLCFLEPLDKIGVIDSKQRFKAHIFHRAHKEKISSVDISPEWPEKRNVITGGYDGVVKEWSIEPKERGWIINYLHCQEEHSVQKEEVAGVCYGTQTIAVSVGTAGIICKWDLNTNVVKRYSTHLKSFKPTCISSSPHKLLHVAVGTRQGVVFVIDISGVAGKLIYKIRGQDDEINRVSWCPQYAVTINKAPGKEGKGKQPFTASTRMDRIRNDLEPSEALEIAIAERNLALEKKDNKKEEQSSDNETNDNEKQEPKENSIQKAEKQEVVIIPEDDMFDVYKDHEDNEFGHKKFEPQDIYVKVKDEVPNDFLAECEKLKADILKKKNEPEESIESLVEAMDKAHVEETLSSSEQAQKDLEQTSTQGSQDSQGSSQDTQKNTEYKHLLASIGKYGGVHIWSQTGKLVASCSILFNVKRDQKDHKNRGPNWPTLHWFKADTLLITDGKNRLLEANPLKLVGKDKLEWRVVHSLHRRGLYFVLSNAPRVQTPELHSETSADWVVWTIGQDRSLISYNMKERKKIEIFTSCGAYLYTVKPCAYDAGKIALTGGDGSIRVWETNTTNELEDQLSSGTVASYWQNVQGKILNAVWHPTKENILAFGTAESRLGILDASGSCEKPAKNFPNSFKQGVYSMTWGEGNDLYACGNGELVMFRANKMDEKGRTIIVEVEGQAWDITQVLWTPHGLVVGANNGGLALLHPTDYHVITATFVYLKMIYTIAWHPQQTTSSQEESKYKNYLALCSSDRVNTISIMEFEDKGEGAKQFNKVMEPLSGHEGAVFTVAWNPHRDAQLLSTSQDGTVRIWNVVEGECVAIFGGHTLSVLGGMWCTQPRLADKVLSCGGDSCLRLWDFRDYPVEHFQGVKKEQHRKKKPNNRCRDERRREKKLMQAMAEAEQEKADDTVEQESTAKPDENDESAQPENVATTVELKLRGSKIFLLPITAKQISKKSMTLVRTILAQYIEKEESIDVPSILQTCAVNEKCLGFLRMFGTMNDVNQLLDYEANRHLMLKDWEAYLMLLFYRGRVDEMIQFASEKDLLDPYLLSLSPTVSFKYWKDTTQLYMVQLDRLAAKGHEDRASAYRFYGGPVYRKATAYLSTHNLKGCVEALMESTLFKEAYLLCRLRHMDSFAEEVLQKWAVAASESGALMLAAIIQMLRGDISEASITLGRSTQINYLQLAAQLAKLAGHNTFATHIEAIVKTKESQLVKEEELEPLPSRIEALLTVDSDESEENSDEESIESEAVIHKNDVNGIDHTANGFIPENGGGDTKIAVNGAKKTDE